MTNASALGHEKAVADGELLPIHLDRDEQWAQSEWREKWGKEENRRSNVEVTC